jgi:hypothetical protein
MTHHRHIVDIGEAVEIADTNAVSKSIGMYDYNIWKEWLKTESKKPSS